MERPPDSQSPIWTETCRKVLVCCVSWIKVDGETNANVIERCKQMCRTTRRGLFDIRSAPRLAYDTTGLKATERIALDDNSLNFIFGIAAAKLELALSSSVSRIHANVMYIGWMKCVRKCVSFAADLLQSSTSERSKQIWFGLWCSQHTFHILNRWCRTKLKAIYKNIYTSSYVLFQKHVLMRLPRHYKKHNRKS